MKSKTSTPKVNKGAPSGLLVSLLVHAGAFLLAGMLVVFTVSQKKEKKFVPPKPVERPKMKLKKPKVKVKKSARPKSTTRIVTHIQKADMPDIQLPEMGGGMAAGLGGGIGGFDLGEVEVMPTILGDEISAGNDLVGTFYSIMRDRSGRPIGYSMEEHQQAIRRFIKSGWKPSSLSKYYRSPKKLYSTMVMVPEMMSQTAPEAFGEDPRDSQYWLVHYKGQLIYPEDITFRFVAQADSTVAVRINGETVLGAQWHQWQDLVWGDEWVSSAADNRKWWMGNWTACVGDWVTLKANEAKDIEILIADAGGLCCLMLAVQVQGVEYETRPGGGPRLPAFKTAYPSRDLQDLIMRDMVPGEVCLTNGPVFNDIYLADTNALRAAGTEVAEETDPAAEPPVSRMRTWTANDGQVVEGEFVTRMGDKVVLKDAQGRQKKVPLNRLSPADLEYIDLCNPPELKVSVSSSEAAAYAYEDGVKSEVIGYDKVYTGKIRKQSPAPYEHELTAEFFAVGVQRYADVYILLDHQTASFRLTKENDESFAFSGKTVRLRKVEPREWESADLTVRGEKEYGYLIVVKDKRGEIIAHKATSPWLFEHYEKLKHFPVGRYMDETVTRVYPVGPPRARY